MFHMKHLQMAAPKGNQFWMLAKNAGRPLEYTPEEFLNVAFEYFQWATENPWYKKEAIKGGDLAGKIVDVPIDRPFTIHGLCIFAGIVIQTFENYAKREEFMEIVTRIRGIIYNQKFEGAAVGAYNSNIIARDLGLADKKEVEKKKVTVSFKDAG